MAGDPSAQPKSPARHSRLATLKARVRGLLPIRPYGEARLPPPLGKERLQRVRAVDTEYYFLDLIHCKPGPLIVTFEPAGEPTT